MPTAPKKGKGHKWTLTNTRKVMIIDMLKKQYTISSIATEFGVSQKTISKALKNEKMNWKAIRKSGIDSLRSRMFSRLEDIDDPKDYVNSCMKVLDKYDTDVEVDTIDSNSSKDKVKEAANKILEELK